MRAAVCILPFLASLVKARRTSTIELSFLPQVATYIDEGDPFNSFASRSLIEVDKGPDRKHALLRFGGLPVSNVEEVKLLLKCADGSINGGTIYKIKKRVVAGVTWKTRPHKSSPHRNGSLTKLASQGRVSKKKTYKVDLSDVIINGVMDSELSLLILPASNDEAYYYKASIELIVTVSERMVPSVPSEQIGEKVLPEVMDTNDDTAKGWDIVPEILERIKPPIFPEQDFFITSFGAVGNGKKDCTLAVQIAINKCHDSGGGRVVVPKGVFLTGAIHLKTGVNLHLSTGAVIRFDRNPDSYLPLVRTRWEGVELMNYSPFIYAYRQENIAITGSGILDGRASPKHWWPWKKTQKDGREKLFEMARYGVAVEKRVFGDGYDLRPNFIQPYECRNVLIEGVTIINTPMWTIHPVLCTNVVVRKVKVDTRGPNSDGCNPDSSTDVLIDGCSFDTLDDCIAIKSGRDWDGRRVNQTSSNIIIRDCKMKDGHGAVVIGSETSGGIKNVFAENCIWDSPNLDNGLRIKTNSKRGGIIEHVFLRNITIFEVNSAAIRVNFLYEGSAGHYVPVLRDVEVRDVVSHKSKYAFHVVGLEDSPVRDFRVISSDFSSVEKNSVIKHTESLDLSGVTINDKKYNTR